MLQASLLYKNFGLVPILHDINFTVKPGDRFGLVGINGTGKTTLLKILVGKEKANKGSINFYPKNLRIGYLPQGLVIDDHSDIGSFLGSEFGEISVLDQKLAQLAESLSKKPDDATGQSEFDLLLNQINQVTEVIHQAPTLMKSLGLGEYDLITCLSGCARIQLSDPG